MRSILYRTSVRCQAELDPTPNTLPAVGDRFAGDSIALHRVMAGAKGCSPDQGPSATTSTALQHVGENDTPCSGDETGSPTEQMFGETIAAD